MKIMEWIFFGLAMLLATTSHSLAADSTRTVEENFNQLETALKMAKDQIADVDLGDGNRWPELEAFQNILWRAMALDPSLVAPVQPNQVPKNLFSAELNVELETKFAILKSSKRAHELNAEAEFNRYAATVEQMLNQRNKRQFPQARATAKRGTLDAAYLPLAQKFMSHEESGEISIPALNQIEDQVRTLKEQVQESTPKVSLKRDVFTNGNKFIGFMIAAFFGFLLGVVGYRMHPDFFQKLLDHFDSNAPTATTHSVGAHKLDYARWLREFEEILSRLKSSQMTIERRIEDIVQNSNKISQHSLSLYADPRIKNEANLEHRMSTLLREAQHQFDQSQRLKTGDRAQINMMLEHCLKLCDAVETNTIHYIRVRTPEQFQPQRNAS